MGTDDRLPARSHARASSKLAETSSLRDAISANTSNVISALPRLAAKATTAAQWGAGMPRRRQPLTTDKCWSSAAATSPSDPGRGGEPPQRSSMIESHVTMGDNIVCTMQTSQGFATRKTTFFAECGAIGSMMDPPHIVAGRLKALRVELGFPSQKAFADRLGIDKSTYNPYETGTRPLTFETACLIRREFGISIDWLFFGDLQQSAIQTMARIGRGTDVPKVKLRSSVRK